MTAPQPSAAPGAPADGGTAGLAPTTTQPQQQNPQTPANAPGAQQQAPAKTDLSTLPADVRKVIEDLRAESAKHRTEGQTAKQAVDAEKQRVAAVLKALGLNADGTDAPADPAALAAQIEQAQAVAWTSAVELNVFKAASASGLNAEALLDSRAFIDSLDQFTEADISTADFGTQLAAHIKAYGEKHPQFKTQQTTAPSRAGTDRAGGSGGAPARQPQGLGAAIRAHYQR